MFFISLTGSEYPDIFILFKVAFNAECDLALNNTLGCNRLLFPSFGQSDSHLVHSV